MCYFCPVECVFDCSLSCSTSADDTKKKKTKTHPKVVHSQFQNQSPVFINRVRRRRLFEYKIFN